MPVTRLVIVLVSVGSIYGFVKIVMPLYDWTYFLILLIALVLWIERQKEG